MTTKIHNRFIDHSSADNNGIRSAQSVMYVTQSSHGFSVLDCLRSNGTSWVAAQADDPDTLAVGVVVSVIDTNNFIVAHAGFFNITHGLGTNNAYYFLSEGSAGALTGTQPSTYSNPLLYTVDSNNILVLPWRPSLTAGGGDFGTGAATFVGEDLSAGSASVMQVTGLDLNADEFYECEYCLAFDGGSGTSNIFITLNSDTAQTGYVLNTSSSNDSTIASSSFAAGTIRVGNFELVYGLSTSGNYIPGIFNKIYSDGVNFHDIYKNMNPATNITSVALRVSGAATFGSGSYLKVYKKHA